MPLNHWPVTHFDIFYEFLMFIEQFIDGCRIVLSSFIKCCTTFSSYIEMKVNSQHIRWIHHIRNFGLLIKFKKIPYIWFRQKENLSVEHGLWKHSKSARSIYNGLADIHFLILMKLEIRSTQQWYYDLHNVCDYLLSQ